MDTDTEGNTAKMSLVEVETYRTELRNELAELEFAQEMIPSEYKQQRINTLKRRLGLPVN